VDRENQKGPVPQVSSAMIDIQNSIKYCKMIKVDVTPRKKLK